MNNRYLIADAGGTSTRWCLCDSAGNIIASHKGHGINATTFKEAMVRTAMAEAEGMLTDAETIYFYGAGCKGEEAVRKIKDSILSFNKAANIFVFSDLVAAARALFGLDSGIACILGTGSNSCAVSEGKIIMNTPPLGYLLGDEGSGTSLGKRLLRETLRGHVDHPEIKIEIEKTTGLNLDKIVAALYKTDMPNKFLSCLAPILSKYKHIPEIQNIIYKEFDRFFNSCITPYVCSGFRSIGFIGSVAAAFESDLRELSCRYGLEFKGGLPSPMPGLIEYHKIHKL